MAIAITKQPVIHPRDPAPCVLHHLAPIPRSAPAARAVAGSVYCTPATGNHSFKVELDTEDDQVLPTSGVGIPAGTAETAVLWVRRGVCPPGRARLCVHVGDGTGAAVGAQ